MADTLDRLTEHHGPGAKAVVWAHNTHVGDARATDMADAGMVNLGQLVRERHGDEGVVVVGFATYEGRVTASRAWGEAPEVMAVPPAREGSVEDLLHRRVGNTAALAVLTGGEGRGVLGGGAPLAHRAIGVVYRPARDRSGNYVPTVMEQRYDAFVHIGRTEALTPLHPVEEDAGEKETWPSGL